MTVPRGLVFDSVPGCRSPIDDPLDEALGLTLYRAFLAGAIFWYPAIVLGSMSPCLIISFTTSGGDLCLAIELCLGGTFIGGLC